jgi:hypothetical protein
MACPVCFTGDDPVVRESLTAGIGVLVGVTLVVLSAFAGFFVVLARRARAVTSPLAPPSPGRYVAPSPAGARSTSPVRRRPGTSFSADAEAR